MTQRNITVGRMYYLMVVALFSVGFASRLLGGWNDADVNSKSVQRIAGLGVRKLSENGEDSEVVEICSAKTQLVAGMNYKLGLIIKNKGSLDDSTNQYCTFGAYEVPWENSLSIHDVSCDKNKNSCPTKPVE